MKTKKLPLKVLATLVLTSVFLAACDDTRVRASANFGPGYGHHGHHGGYLTHTPHRHRVSYNSDLGLYVVLGLSNTYYSNGSYYRYYNSGWQRSRDYRIWSRLGNTGVPKRLYARHYKKPRYKQPPRKQIRQQPRRQQSHTQQPRRGQQSNGKRGGRGILPIFEQEQSRNSGGRSQHNNGRR